MSTRVFWKAAYAGLFLCALITRVSAQIEKLYQVGPGEGIAAAGVIQGFDGFLYGTASKAVFKLPPRRFATDTVLYYLCSQPGCTEWRWANIRTNAGDRW